MGTATDYASIYRDHADEYDLLVEAEDCDGNLLPALEAIVPIAGAEALDVGVGTGRIARLLLAHGARVVGVDRAPAMLAVARRHLERYPADRWELHRADAAALPVASGWADVAIAGWAFGHMRYEHAEAWRDVVARAIAEMRRALRPAGALIIIETLGTGTEVPRPPSAELEEYFAWLESEHGMQRKSIRTDYQFADAETAARATRFFFGPEFAARVRERDWSRIPECTGIWWSR
jgi:ubiquinone/menaquinone biosynthesis C-methylase UbiE